MTKYVALLRGINVGGHKPIKMEELKKTFELLGFQNVKTLLASGNVIFEISNASTDGLVKKIEGGLKKTFGHTVGILIRTIDEIKNLVDANPFKNTVVNSQTRLYVTFLSEKSSLGLGRLNFSSMGVRPELVF